MRDGRWLVRSVEGLATRQAGDMPNEATVRTRSNILISDVTVNARNATGLSSGSRRVEELGRFADDGNGICAEPHSERT